MMPTTVRAGLMVALFLAAGPTAQDTLSATVNSSGIGRIVSVERQTKYGVTAEADKKIDFATLKTYAWSSGSAAVDKSVDAQIVAAIDRELAKAGLAKLPSSSRPDVLVAYDSVQRTDVDLKGKANKEGILPTYPVGTLVVRLLDPTGQRQLFRARIDTPISSSREKLETEINAAVAAIFEKYPARSPRR